MFKISSFCVLLCLAHPALAADCPAVGANAIETDQLHSQLISAESEMQARNVSDQIWVIWMTAPDDTAQELLDRGRERIRVADYEKAIEFFTDLVEYCPHYAEGWNQRAYVYLLRQEYEASLNDISKAIEHEPRHFGALVGRASVLIEMGRTKVGYAALRAALNVNPWLTERYLLPVGEDI